MENAEEAMRTTSFGSLGPGFAILNAAQLSTRAILYDALCIMSATQN